MDQAKLRDALAHCFPRPATAMGHFGAPRSRPARAGGRRGRALNQLNRERTQSAS